MTNTEIKEIRKGLNMTQTEFAAAIGCDKSTVARLEKGDGKKGPSPLIVREITRVRDSKTKTENA